MTTTVILQFPKPNHLCARIVKQHKDQFGEWNSVPMSALLGPDSEVMVEYVHSSQRLIIEEIAANEDLPLPLGTRDVLLALSNALEKVAPKEFSALRDTLFARKERHDAALDDFLKALKVEA